MKDIMRIYDEGNLSVRGALDGEKAWILIGDVLYKVNMERADIERVCSFSGLLGGGKLWGFNIRVEPDYLLLAMNDRKSVCFVGKDGSLRRVIGEKTSERKEYFVQFMDNDSCLFISMAGAELFVLRTDGGIEQKKHFTIDLMRELSARKLHFKNIRYYGTAVNKNELIVDVRNSERDLFFIYDKNELKPKRVIDPVKINGTISDFLYDTDYIWFYNRRDDNWIVKYDIGNKCAKTEIKLPNGFGKRVILRKMDNKILAMSIKGNMGIIGIESGEIETICNGIYFPLDVALEKHNTMLCSNGRDIVVYEYDGKKISLSNRIPIKSDLAVFMDSIS